LLPNVTDRMLHPDLRAVPPTLWKFILERISVQPHHETMASKLLEDIKMQSKKFLQKRASMRQSFRRSSVEVTSGAVGTESMGEETADDDDKFMSEADINREKIFKELNDPPKVREDAVSR